MPLPYQSNGREIDQSEQAPEGTNPSLPDIPGPRGLHSPRVPCPSPPPKSCLVHCVCKDGAHGGWALKSSRPVWFQVFQQLKAAHAALEEEYLKACREQHVAQQLAGSTGTPGRFDPGRYLLGKEASKDRWVRPWVPTRRGTVCPHNSHTRGTGRNPIPINNMSRWGILEG